MSEFKYACPVCGQHIKCDASQAGVVMDCPTCFQKITVPPAPASADQKFIPTGLKAVAKKTSFRAAAGGSPAAEPARKFPAAIALVLVLAGLAVGAGVFFFVRSPSKWQTVDIGAVGVPGVFSQQAETLHLAGAGADIWSQADAFCYVSKPVSGDVSLTARVAEMSNPHPWAKAGLMVRETLAPDAANVMVCVTANNGVEFQRRTQAGAQADSILITPRLRAPCWLRLTRQGSVFTAEISADGTTWKSAGSTTVAMPAGVRAGLGVCAHNHTTLCRASFDHVSVKAANAAQGP